MKIQFNVETKSFSIDETRELNKIINDLRKSGGPEAVNKFRRLKKPEYTTIDLYQLARYILETSKKKAKI